MITSKLDEEPQLVLLDLGIVSLASDPSLTNTSTFLGSKHTAPFEQLTGGVLDERSDIYAAGASLFHCYSGVPMYHRDGPEGGIVARMLRSPATLTIRANSAAIHQRVVAFINECIAVEPARRPSSADECATLMREAARQAIDE
jgi:serine/threonine-protein kinase